MELNEFQKNARKTALYPNVGNNFIYPTLGLTGEAGEVADKVKKILRDHHGIFDEASKEELVVQYPNEGDIHDFNNMN